MRSSAKNNPSKGGGTQVDEDVFSSSDFLGGDSGSMLLLGQSIDDRIETTPMGSRPTSPEEEIDEQLGSSSVDYGDDVFDTDDNYEDSFESLSPTRGQGQRSDFSASDVDANAAATSAAATPIISQENSNYLTDFSSITFNNSSVLLQEEAAVQKKRKKASAKRQRSSPNRKKASKKSEESTEFVVKSPILYLDRLSSSRGNRSSKGQHQQQQEDDYQTELGLQMAHFFAEGSSTNLEDKAATAVAADSVAIKHPLLADTEESAKESSRQQRAKKQTTGIGVPAIGVAKAAHNRKATPHGKQPHSADSSDRIAAATTAATAVDVGLPPSGLRKKDSSSVSSRKQATVVERSFESVDVASLAENSVNSHAEFSSLSRYAPHAAVTSVVSKEAAYSYNPAVLQRQLQTARQQLSAYSKANDLLQRKLDQRNIDEAVEKYRALLLQKEQQINDLQAENSSLRQIAHQQGRKLEDGAHKQRHHDLLDTELTQEKQIEIMVTHVHKVRSKLVASYEQVHQLERDNAKLLKLREKDHRKNLRMKRELRIAHDVNEQLRQHLLRSLNMQQMPIEETARQVNGSEQQAQQRHHIANDDDEDSTSDFRHMYKELNNSPTATATAISSATNKFDSNTSTEASIAGNGAPIMAAKATQQPQQQRCVVLGDVAVSTSAPSTAAAAATTAAMLVDDGSIAAGIPMFLLTGLNSNSRGGSRLNHSRSKQQTSVKLSKQVDDLQEENSQQQLRLRALQKNLDAHRATSQHEIQALKSAAEKALAEQKRLAKELNKRELFARTQMIALKQLRSAYDELLQSCKHLYEASELYNRDTAVQSRSQQPAATAVAARMQPTPPPPQQRPSSSNIRKLAPKAALISEEEDLTSAVASPPAAAVSAADGSTVSNIITGGNFTFMTSDMDATK